MIKTFYEIFDEVEKCKTKKEKIAKLQKHSGPALKQVLGYTFDPNVKWLLPEGTPPYKSTGPDVEAHGRLHGELRKLYLFVEGNTEVQRDLKQVKREVLYIELLESVDPGDAKVLLAMKDKKLPFKSITKKLVSEAFPNLSKNW